MPFSSTTPVKLDAFFADLRARIEDLKQQVSDLTGSEVTAPSIAAPSGGFSLGVFSGNEGPNRLQGDANNLINIVSAKGGNDTVTGTTSIDIVIGGAGIDTIDYSYLNGSGSGVFIDLANRFAAVGGGDVDIVGGFENVIDSTGNDVLLGDSAGNIFRLLGGHDIVNGRGGTDVVQLEGMAEEWDFTILMDAEGQQIGVEATKGTHTVKAYGVEFFQFKDGSSGGESMFRVKVEPTDEAEGIAKDDSANVDEDRSVFLNLVDNDEFLGALMPKIIAESFGGTPVEGYPQTFSVEGKYGTLTINVANGEAVYKANKADSLAEGIKGFDTFTYGINGDDAQITITITGTNDAPVVSGAVTGEATE
ncbi:MAG: VCBS domain-containing protein [Limimaricola soesokkakensis]|uniref:VCBS domain-containing protein n=1 Tax=Limimaricola soesokkakensis TaxID=1343159 RepID=UPI004059A817